MGRKRIVIVKHRPFAMHVREEVRDRGKEGDGERKTRRNSASDGKRRASAARTTLGRGKGGGMDTYKKRVHALKMKEKERDIDEERDRQ